MGQVAYRFYQFFGIYIQGSFIPLYPFVIHGVPCAPFAPWWGVGRVKSHNALVMGNTELEKNKWYDIGQEYCIVVVYWYILLMRGWHVPSLYVTCPGDERMDKHGY